MEAQTIIKEIAEKLQRIDEQIFELKEARKEILKEAKDDGINSTLLNKAITQIRQEKKKPLEKSELELYLNIVEPVVEVLS